MTTQADLHDDHDSRREFLKKLVVALNGLWGLALAVPGAGYVLTPLFQKPIETWVELGKEEDFPQDRIHPVTFFEGEGLAYVMRNEEETLVFSPVCTHKGCNVGWSREQDRFLCPCHGGQYDRQGQVVAGPPPRGLDQFETKVSKGVLSIKVVQS